MLATSADPIVPLRQMTLYQRKVRRAGTQALLDARQVTRYGHCEFTLSELLGAFLRLARRDTETAALLESVEPQEREKRMKVR